MTDMPPQQAPDPTWTQEQFRRQVAFLAGAIDPRGGFGYLDTDGTRRADRGRELFITCRMTYVGALAVRWAAHDPVTAATGRDLAEHGIAALTGVFADTVHGGWFSAVDDHGIAVPGRKEAYGHAFVVLAAATATAAGVPGAQVLLHTALRVLDERFWEADAGAVRESYARDWTDEEAYRGANSNMHTVEALLAAADALDRVGDSEATELRRRALSICSVVIDVHARAADWWLPEHFDPSWTPLPQYNREEPAHPFRPYGSTIGHWFEWARLLLQLRAALGETAPAWLEEAARALTDAGLQRGWAADGTDGFAYTYDWDGTVVVADRMHWVLTEAISAVGVLAAVTGRQTYRTWYARLWAHARECFVEPARGTWIHQLDATLTEDGSVWPGRPDAYHVAGALLIPSRGVRGSLISALG